MEEYVLVALEEWDKVIKYGPILLEDPSTYPVPEGNRIMLASEALAAGYRYPEGGAASVPEGEEEAGDGESDNDADGEPAEDHGKGKRGAQGREGGQGAQAQPGSGRKRRGKARDDDSEK